MPSFKIGDKVIVKSEYIDELIDQEIGWITTRPVLEKPFIIYHVEGTIGRPWVSGFIVGSRDQQAMYIQYIKHYDEVVLTKEELLIQKINQLWTRQEYYKCHQRLHSPQ